MAGNNLAAGEQIEIAVTVEVREREWTDARGMSGQSGFEFSGLQIVVMRGGLIGLGVFLTRRADNELGAVGSAAPAQHGGLIARDRSGE